MGDSSKDQLKRRDTSSKQITEAEHATAAAQTGMRLVKEAAGAAGKPK